MALIGFLAADKAAVAFDFPQSYARINHIIVTKDSFQIVVNFYADASARALNALPVLQKQYDCAPLPGDCLPAAYAYIKTLPDFAGWVDA
jgi:hypothetical protein